MKFILFPLMTATLLMEGGVSGFAVGTPKQAFRSATTRTPTSFGATSSLNMVATPLEDTRLTKGIEAFLEAPENFIYDYVNDDSPDLQDLLVSQLLGSMMMYSFAKVRAFVRENPDKDWFRPELILTQKAATVNDDSVNYHRYMKHPVSVAAQYAFVANQQNWQYLQDCDDIDTQDDSPYNIRDTLDTLQQRVNAEIVEFDDQFADKDLVYGITVNRTNKRITVFFRGSVLGGKDWTTNANVMYKTLEPTDAVKKARFTKEIKVHRGFQSYLFAEEDSATVGFEEKFEQIVGNIRSLYEQEEYKGYRLCIAGHSLGGALTQLLAYHLGSTGAIKDVIPDRPITAISFASPQVGNEGYNQAFQELERKGLVQHLRVSNQGDVVPVGPFGWGYTQTGLHIHLKDNERTASIGYRNLKSQMSQLSLDAGANHSLERYYERLVVDANREVLESNTIETLYDQHAGDFSE